MSFECFLFSIQPKFNPTFLSSVKQCVLPKENDKSEFNCVLVELCSNKNECFLFHCILDAVIVTQKFVSRHLSIVAVNYIRFLHRQFQKSMPDLSCLKPTKDKNVMPTRLICYLLPLFLINKATLFKVTALSYRKIICTLFQL